MTVSLGQFDSYGGYLSAKIISGTPPESAFYREFYSLLKAYYAQNSVYEIINSELQQVRISNKDIKGIRNPAYRVTEFYAGKLWSGHDLERALPILADNKRILEPIRLVWLASNFAVKKQMAARRFANLGDMVIKLNTKQDTAGQVVSVYQEFLDPTYASEIETDERGFVTYIRLDIPRVEKNANGTEETWYHTEVWNKATLRWSIWFHNQGADVELDKIKEQPIQGTFEDTHRADFVPFVYQPFRDDGFGRANGCFTAVLDKIDECNKKATRLAQLLFRHNRADKALTSDAMDSSGRPLPPPRLDAILAADNKITIEGETFWRLPSGWKIEHLIAPLDYESHLKALQDDMLELENDLPELAYSRISQHNDLSGRALRYMLEGAISRLLEARGNGEAAFVRANQMALTIGQEFNLWRGIGTFEAGDFDHSFAERDVLQPDKREQAETAGLWVTAGASLEKAAIEVGITEDRAQELARGDIIPPNFGVNER